MSELKKDALTNLAALLQQESDRQAQAANVALEQPKKGENVIGCNGEIVTLGVNRPISKK